MCFDGAKSFCVDDRRKPFDCAVLDALLISDVIYTILCTMRAFYAKLIKINFRLCPIQLRRTLRSTFQTAHLIVN